MTLDKETFKELLKYPFSYNGKGYIRDSDNNVVLMIESRFWGIGNFVATALDEKARRYFNSEIIVSETIDGVKTLLTVPKAMIEDEKEERRMNRIEELFCDIGNNVKVFIAGAIASFIGYILAHI
jgi:hypothetical protein